MSERAWRTCSWAVWRRESCGRRPVLSSPFDLRRFNLTCPSAFSGHLLGNNQGFVVRTTEVSIHTFHQFCCRQQTAGLDHGPFPMDPMCLQGVEPRTFDGQETRHNAQAVAVMFDPLVVLSEPVSHGTAAMPRGIIPYQQQRRFACSGQEGTEPG